MDFEKKSIFVDNHIDSVFVLNFRLSNDTIISWCNDPNKLWKNKILKISKDTLIFEEFLNNKHEDIYTRIKRDFEN